MMQMELHERNGTAGDGHEDERAAAMMDTGASM
jgi:hypothetical protein